MPQLTIEGLRRIKEETASQMALREGRPEGGGTIRHHLLICAGLACITCGSLKVRERLEKELKDRGLESKVKVVITGCAGLCAEGPLMLVYPEGTFYRKLTPEDVSLIVEEHILKGKPVEKLFYKDPTRKVAIPRMKDIPFFGNQHPRVLRNQGLINPEDIDEYIARDGYEALHKALTQMTPGQVIAEVKESGLRGRGGAGFPTGDKWEEGRKYDRFPKYVICNGDEGDPGAFMDRSVLESDPHAILEGMAIGAYAIDAHEGYLYVRAEYPLAIKRLNIAIDQAREQGLLGKDIFGTGFNFDAFVYQGAGAFVCGESTALMYSLEGKRGMPRIKPPRSVESGLWGQPTVLNNVETFANIPQIILKGAKWYNRIGTEKCKGTKVFSLAGEINNVGLLEVPMGVPLRFIVYDIGGGIKSGKKFKAAQLGGPSGGFVPEKLIDTPVDYESLEATGAIMGSGGIVICDQGTCMVESAHFFTHFCTEESCGKCIPCRIGLTVMLQKLEEIIAGKGEEGDIEFLEELGKHIIQTSHCGLGQSAPNPVLSTIRHFRDEYDAHIRKKKCPALVCIELIDFVVNPEKCTKCGLCFKACPVDAVSWEKKQPAKINKELCTKCRSCIKVCKFMAIE
jgi:NADH:ubiquinone oxidoreductase subunit F (NADH-binding)/(2Fe-2S) ferredoxin/NAD-dependent dihydropyrimidine dehydrogenase PreA subunit